MGQMEHIFFGLAICLLMAMQADTFHHQRCPGGVCPSGNEHQRSHQQTINGEGAEATKRTPHHPSPTAMLKSPRASSPHHGDGGRIAGTRSQGSEAGRKTERHVHPSLRPHDLHTRPSHSVGPKPEPNDHSQNKTFMEQKHFLGNFYCNFLGILRVEIGKYNSTLPKKESREIFQQRKQQRLSTLIREFLKIMIDGKNKLKDFPRKYRTVSLADEYFVKEFALRLQKNSSFFMRRVLDDKLDWKNETRCKIFVKNHIRNVSRVYYKILDWLMKAAFKRYLNLGQSCKHDCRKIEQMMLFCKKQYRICTDEENDRGRERTVSIGRSQAPRDDEQECAGGQHRCPLGDNCQLDDASCIQDRDIFPRDANDENEEHRPDDSRPERHMYAKEIYGQRPSIRRPSPAIRPSPLADERVRDFLRAGFAGRSLPPALQSAIHRIRPSVVALLSRGLDAHHNLDSLLGKSLSDQLRGLIAPSKSSNASKDRRHCFPLCHGRNTSFCWAEMRCKENRKPCGLKNLIKIMSTVKMKNSSKCDDDSKYYCPVLMKCTNTRAECNTETYRRSCDPRNATCLSKGDMRSLNASNAEEIEEIFGLICPKNRTYCPGIPRCIKRNASCADYEKQEMVERNNTAHPKRLYCRIRVMLCPRVYSFWTKMRRGCKQQNIDGQHPKRNESARNPHSGRTRPIHNPRHTIKPSGSRTINRPHRTNFARPDRSTLSEQRKPTTATIVHPSIGPPRRLPLVLLDPRQPLRYQLGRVPPMFIAVAVGKGGPISWNFQALASHQRRDEQIREIPSLSQSGKMTSGLIIPTSGILSFTINRPTFHGAIILKYTPFNDDRQSAFTRRRIPEGSLIGRIVILIYPKLPKVSLQFVVKNYREIDEDEENPPSFKVGDVARFTSYDVNKQPGIPSNLIGQLDHRVLEQYRKMLDRLKKFKPSVAIIGYKGHPWHDGVWYVKKQPQKPKKRIPFSCSRRNPFILSLEDRVSFSPKKNFNGMVWLKLAVAFKNWRIVYNRRKKAFEEEEFLDVGDKTIRFQIKVKDRPDRPVLKTTDACLPPLSFGLTHGINNGFAVEEILSRGARRCGRSARSDRGEPIVEVQGRQDIQQFGIAITKTSECHDGHWEYKDWNGQYQRINLGLEDNAADGSISGLCLNSSASIRYVPRNYSELWDISHAFQCMWIEMLLWASPVNSQSQKCNIAQNSTSFSIDKLQLTLLRAGCDNVPGSMQHPDRCGKCGDIVIQDIACDCDGYPRSGAILDECGRCSGGRSGRTYHKKDCANFCYPNGTKSRNIWDGCGNCQERQHFKNPRDCSGKCIRGRQKACINRCGVCVEGSTGRQIDHGVSECGTCVSNPSQSCTKSFILKSATDINVNEEFGIIIKIKGSISIRIVTCSLHGPDSSSSVMNLGKTRVHQNRIMQRKINESYCDDLIDMEHFVQYRGVIVNRPGRYAIKCSADNTEVLYLVNGKKLNAISTSSIVSGYHPMAIETGKRQGVLVKGSGFQNTSGLMCVAILGRNQHMGQGKVSFINESSVSCDLPSFKYPCKIAVVVLTSFAVKRPTVDQSAPKLDVYCSNPMAVKAYFPNGIRNLIIRLDKIAVPVSGRRRPRCSEFFDQPTVEKLGNSAKCALFSNVVQITLPLNTKLFDESSNTSVIILGFRRNTFRCRWPVEARSVAEIIQFISVKVPVFNVKAVIDGDSEIGSCDKARMTGWLLTGGVGGKLKFDWKLLKNNVEISKARGKSFFSIEGSELQPNAEYICSLCVSNVFGQQSCDQKKIKAVNNQNNTIHVRIPGLKDRKLLASRIHIIRPKVYMTSCGKKQEDVPAMHLLWQIKSNRAKNKTIRMRNLAIMPGDLLPGINYTLSPMVWTSDRRMAPVQAEINVQMIAVSLKAKILGGEYAIVGCKAKVVLDGSPSRDPNAIRLEAVYEWECRERDGSPCYKPSGERIILQSRKRVELLVVGNLRCNHSYIFHLRFSKGSMTDTAKLLVKTRPGDLAEVKLEQKRVKNILIINAHCKTKSSAIGIWNSVEGEGLGMLSLGDKSLARHQGRFEIKKNRRSRRKYAIGRHRLLVFLDKLPLNTTFKVKVDIENEEGNSSAEISFQSLSPPAVDELSIEPANGIALNTSFDIGGIVSRQKGISFEFGFIEDEAERVIQSYSDRNVLEGIELPPGDEGNDFNLTVYMKAKNDNGISTKTTTTVKVRKPTVVNIEQENEAVQKTKKLKAEGNLEAAANVINNAVKTFSSSESFAKEAVDISKKASPQESGIIIQTLESVTKHTVASKELPGDVKEQIGEAVKKTLLGLAEASNLNPRRKRRSVETTTGFTPRSKEEVDSVMATFDNIINENEPGSLQDNIKGNYTDSIPSLLRSLCAGVIENDAFSTSKSNLSTIRAIRVAGDSLDANKLNLSQSEDGTSVLLGSYLKMKYEQWNCSDNHLLCTEICIGSALHHHNMLKGDDTGRISDIAKIILIHPETYSIEEPGILQSTINLTMKLTEAVGSEYTVKCQAWSSAESNWTSENCKTEYSGSDVALCSCLTLESVAVFKEMRPIVLPPIGIEESTSTIIGPEQEKTSSFGSILSKSTADVAITMTVSLSSIHGSSSTSTSAVEPTSASSSVHIKGKIPSIKVQFTLSADYNKHAAGDKKDGFIQALTEILASKLQISKNRIRNVEVKPGSIIVTFTLLENDGNPNEIDLEATKTVLEEIIESGNLTLKLKDGTVLSVDPSSLRFGSDAEPPPVKERKSSKKPILIIAVVMILLSLLIIFLLTRFYIVHKRHKTKVSDSRPESARTLVVDTISLEERSIASPAPQEEKKPISDGNFDPFKGKDVVSVGIGSSASLKKPAFTDC